MDCREWIFCGEIRFHNGRIPVYPHEHNMDAISLTPAAREELSALLERKAGPDGAGLRLAVRRGGCAGWQYEMCVAQPESGDVIHQDGAARVIIAADSLERLRGCQIDFSADLTDAGFKIHNPLATRSCGCGTSFETGDAPAPGDAQAGSCG